MTITGTPQRTQEQARMAQAWQDVAAIAKAGFANDYKQLVRSAPADIQTNGLGQVVAFWRSKKKDAQDKLYEHLSDWLVNRVKLAKPDLQKWITDANTTSSAYMRATREAIAYLEGGEKVGKIVIRVQ